MSGWRWGILFAAGLGVAILAARSIRTPGYMDADYYAATAGQLAQGRGFSEPFLWNYLDDPQGLPHPSHLYWQPLTSIVAAASLAVFGPSFRAAQLPFILATALLPLLTAAIALRLSGDAGQATLAGLLAALPGFYLPFFVTTDSFSPFALIGGLSLALTAEVSRRPTLMRWLAVGALAGLAHLTRTDGVLLALPALAVAVGSGRGRRVALAAILGAYLAVMAPWWARNLRTVGSLMAPGGARVLWLTSYDELFTYPASQLTASRWLSSGWAAIGLARLQAVWANLKTLVAVNGLIFLVPLMIWGAVRQRHEPLVRAALIYLGGLFLLMSLAFPFAGARGGYFHSSAALMPVLWALVPSGLGGLIALGARLRGWEPDQARRVLSVGAVALAGLLTAGLLWTRVLGCAGCWDAGALAYSRVGARLAPIDPSVGVTAVNNPPGFFLATGRQAVVIPDGDAAMLNLVVRRYRVAWVILDANRPGPLADLYAGRENSTWLQRVDSLPGSGGQPLVILRVINSGLGP